MKKNVDDYLQEGIYGSKEINSSERKLYLGTLRERVILVLTKAQVFKAKGIQELDRLLLDNQDALLLLNGKVSFRYFKKYKQLAKKYNIPYKIVNNKEASTDYGVVLTSKYAIDKEDIFYKDEENKKVKPKKRKSFWQRLFQSK